MLVLHPNCFACDNCQLIRPKRGRQIRQDEDGKQETFCKECIDELDEQLSFVVEFEEE